MASASADQTPGHRRRHGAVSRAGDVVLLVGSLGAGKTTFVQGVVAALGGVIRSRAPPSPSPTSIGRSPPVTHVDLWRLGHLQEVVDLALEEELDEGGVVVVEWGDAAEPLYGADALVVRLGWGDCRWRADDRPRGPRRIWSRAGSRGLARSRLGRAAGGREGEVLAIETATIEVGVAIADETGPLATVTARPGRRQAETLASRHRGRMPDRAGLGLPSSTPIAVDIGPGCSRAAGRRRGGQGPRRRASGSRS